MYAGGGGVRLDYFTLDGRLRNEESFRARGPLPRERTSRREKITRARRRRRARYFGALPRGGGTYLPRVCQRKSAPHKHTFNLYTYLFSIYLLLKIMKHLTTAIGVLTIE